jgi:hypothetical protein
MLQTTIAAMSVEATVQAIENSVRHSGDGLTNKIVAMRSGHVAAIKRTVSY